jgi:hypothetical protein
MGKTRGYDREFEIKNSNYIKKSRSIENGFFIVLKVGCTARITFR